MKKLLLTSLLFSASLQAAAQAPLPPAVQQFEKQGITLLKEVETPGGLRSWLGEYQGTGVTVWLTPDGKHAISGYLYDAEGKNLSEETIKHELYIPEGRRLWQKLSAAPGIKEGNPQAPRKIVLFADPFCPYCKQFRTLAQPWLEAGKVEITTLLVAVINPQSGRYATAILSVADPVKAWREYELSGGKTVPPFPEKTPPAIFTALQYHQRLMDETGASATPAIYYMNDQQELQQVVGLPDAQQIAAITGEK